MEQFDVLINTVITMFLLLVIGYAARKLTFIDDKMSRGLSKLIINVAQPFMIIAAVVAIPYSTENVMTGSYIIILGLAVHLVTAVISFTATFKFKDNDERRISEFALIFANCGFMGFPILKSVFGDIGLFWGSFYIIVYNIVTWTYGMYILGRARSEIKISPLKMVLNFGTTPCLIGIALFLLRVPIPDPLMTSMQYMSSLCTPLSMLIVGGLLATIPLKELFARPKIFYLCAIRLIAVPTVVILIASAVGIGLEYTLFVAIMASLPVASNTGMFAERYDIKPAYAAHTVGMSTLISAATIPVMIYFARLVYSAING